MKAILMFLIGILLTFGSHGQDRALEFDMLGRRQAIQNAGIKEQIELVAEVWRNSCEKDSAKIRNRYLFDTSGRLMQVDEYGSEGIRKSIHYKPKRDGRYSEKEYRYYDSLGNVQNNGKWSLTFDSKGRPVKEVLSINQNIERTNIIKYDKKGNCVEQGMNGWWKWSFEFNRQRQIVASKECRLENDSMVARCFISCPNEFTEVLSRCQQRYQGQICDQAATILKFTFTSSDKLKLPSPTVKSRRLIVNSPVHWRLVPVKE
jgi:hypothetical protein